MRAVNQTLCAVYKANGGNTTAGTQLVNWAMKVGVERE